MKLADFPKIAIHVQIEHGSIQSTRLALSPFFSCTFSEEHQIVLEWLEAYSRRQPFPISLPCVARTPFQEKVLKALQGISFGETVNYSQLAQRINSKAFRATGRACGNNPIPLLIPCHRVIAADRTIGGFSSDIEIKRRLLEFEGKKLPSKK